MRIVIIGGTGNIGTALTRRLAAEHDVRVVARRLPDNPEKSLQAVDWHRADIAVDDLGPALQDADVVVHLAWRFQPTRDPDITWRTNVVGTERLLAAVEQADTSRFRLPARVGSRAMAAVHRPPPASTAVQPAADTGCAAASEPSRAGGSCR